MGQSQTETLEREVKFGAPLGIGLPDLRDLVHRTERLPRQQLRTAYFDTSDGRLWNQDITLRHRTTEGDSAGKWTLKLPAAAGGPTLNRTEVSWEGPRDEIPRDASAIVRGLVRQRPLQQLVELASTRQRLLLHNAADRTLAEIDDDTVAVKRRPSGWPTLSTGRTRASRRRRQGRPQGDRPAPGGRALARDHAETGAGHGVSRLAGGGASAWSEVVAG